jgi:hypothetical protein
MLANGNGRPEVCAMNLLKITRGEVPYERIKGRDGSLIARSSRTGLGEMAADVDWLLTTYEPRVQTDSIDIDATLSAIGEFGINANIIRREATE